MPWWNPYGWWAYAGWPIVTGIGLILVAVVYVLDWITPKRKWGSLFLGWLEDR